jgi:hypothetical protein
MAPDDFWARKRREEEKAEEERARELERAGREESRNKKLGLNRTAAPTGPAPFAEQVKEATVLIEQLNHLYNQFKTGVMALPPSEKRARLAHLVTQMIQAPKTTPSDRFQFASLHATYEAHVSKWDKLIHDLETGKIKRFTGPKRG